MSENQNDDSLDEVRSQPQSNPPQKKAKNAAETGKKVANTIKKLKNMGTLGTVGLFLIALIVIIFIAVGIYGFMMTLPGLSAEKITKTAKNFWRWLSNDDSIEVDQAEMNELAEYIQSMGYDIVAYGFAQSGRVSTNGSEINIAENDNKNITNVRASNIYAYVLANERTYTIVGTSSGVRTDALFDAVTFGGLRKKVAALRKIFSGSTNPNESDAHYGMLRFDESLLTSIQQSWDGFKVSVDRNSNQLVIDTGRGTSVDRMTWDLTGWTSRYGKPIELSLALHLSTMAPDFVYDFCMDDDLQTEVELATKKTTYSDIKYKYIKEGASKAATQADVEKYYKEIKSGQDDLIKEDSLLSESLYISKNNSGNFIAPMDVFFDTSVIEVQKKDSEGNYKRAEYYRAVNKTGKSISLTKNYEVSIDEDGVPRFEEKKDGNVQYLNFILKSLINDPSEEAGEILKLSDGTIIKLKILALNDLKTLDGLGQLKDEDGDREILVETMLDKYDYITTIETFDDYINSTIINNKDKFKEDSIDFTLNLKNCSDLNERTFKSWTFNTMDDTKKNDYPEHNAKEVWQKIYSNAVMGRTVKHLGDACLDYDFQNWIQDEVDQLKLNRYQIDQEFISDEVKEYLYDTNLDVGELIQLHEIFDELKTSIDTFTPYIKKVTHHWFKDVYFIDDNYNAYDMNVTSSLNEEFIPSDGFSTENMDNFRQKGKFYYEGSTQNGIAQLRDGKEVMNEPWHYKVKNWIQYGYYLLYDGTEETALDNERTLQWLKINGYYYPENPLLLNKYATDSNGELDAHKNLGVSGTDVAEIDRRAKEINEELAKLQKQNDEANKDNENYTGAYKARLQKINFKKQNSLTALSILEGVHTEDSEQIYSDLKRFLVELGYFKYSDFDEIETDVFEWLLPDYEVFKDEWPDPKYEKVDNEYGSYIRSKASLDAQKAKEQEEARKETEENEYDDNKTNHLSNIYSNNSNSTSTGNISLIEVGKRCWEYIVNSGKYVYNGTINKPIPPTEQNLIDCSSFVSWILYEAGYSDFGGGQKNTTYFMNTNFKDLYGWTEINVNGDCTSKIQPGDIVVRDGHITFVKSIDSNGKVIGYDCGDQSFWQKSNINGVDITYSAIKVAGNAKIIRLKGTAQNAAVKIDVNSANTTTIAGVQLTDVYASEFDEEGFATITTVNGISYKNYKQGTYPGMGVTSQYSQMALPGCGDTFGYVGCGPTSTAIVLSAYGVTGTTGSDALPYVCGKLCGTHDGGTNSCESIKQAFEHYNVPATVYYTSSGNAKNTIDKALKEGKPVVANVNGGYYSPGGHYIAILGYDNNDNLVISNPCGNEIYGVCGGYSVRSGVSLDYFVQNALGGGSGTYLIPDETPTGFAISGSIELLPELEGFETDLDVIMPENGKIIEIGKVETKKDETDKDNTSKDSKNDEKDNTSSENDDTKSSSEENNIEVTGDYIIIKFTGTGHGVNNWKMKIEGFALDTENVKKDAIINKNEVIGKTTESNIKLTLYDEKDAILDNIADYFKLLRRNQKKSSASSEYGKLFFVAYEGGGVDIPGYGPEIVGQMWGDGEYGVGICQWTVTPSDDSPLASFLDRLYNKDTSFCSELKAFLGISLHPASVRNELEEVFGRMAKKDKEHLLELEMEVAIEEKEELTRAYWPEYEWVLEKSDPVVATWFSLMNYGPGLDWGGRSGITPNMSDEEIIKRLCYQGGIQANSQVGNLMNRFESQARLAVDILNGKVDAEKFMREGTASYPEYENGKNSGYLNGYR